MVPQTLQEMKLLNRAMHVVAGDTAIMGVQIILTQLYMGSIGNGHIGLAIGMGVVQSVYTPDEILQRSLKLADIDVLGIDPPYRNDWRFARHVERFGWLQNY